MLALNDYSPSEMFYIQNVTKANYPDPLENVVRAQ